MTVIISFNAGTMSFPYYDAISLGGYKIQFTSRRVFNPCVSRCDPYQATHLMKYKAALKLKFEEEFSSYIPSYLYCFTYSSVELLTCSTPTYLFPICWLHANLRSLRPTCEPANLVGYLGCVYTGLWNGSVWNRSA